MPSGLLLPWLTAWFMSEPMIIMFTPWMPQPGMNSGAAMQAVEILGPPADHFLNDLRVRLVDVSEFEALKPVLPSAHGR